MIGCIRAGGRPNPMKTIRGLMLSSTNVYALITRDDEGKVARIRLGEVAVFPWRDRGVTIDDLDTAGYQIFRGDLRIRHDGLMAASIADRAPGEIGQPLHIYSRDYGHRTTSISRDLEVAGITYDPSEEQPVAHVADDVTVVEGQDSSGGSFADLGPITFVRHDGEDVYPYRWGYESWPGMVGAPAQSRTTSPQVLSMRAHMSNRAYRASIASADGAWAFGIVNGPFVLFCDGKSQPVQFTFEYALPPADSTTTTDWTGITGFRPVCVMDEATVRVEVTVQRWVWRTQVGRQYAPSGGGPVVARLYAQEEFVFDVLVGTGGIESSNLTASQSATYSLVGNPPSEGQSDFRELAVAWNTTGFVYSAAYVTGGEFRGYQQPADQDSDQYANLFVALDGAEKWALVLFAGTWYLYSDANGYITIDQNLFDAHLDYTGQTAVLNELQVTQGFYEEFMGESQ